MAPSLTPAELAQLVEDIAAADVIDALMKMYDHRGHIIGLTGPAKNTKIVGPAVTISFLPLRKDLMDPQRHSLGPAIYNAVENHEPEGSVLVISSNGHPDTSLGGSTKLSRVANLKMAGIVCDGRLRDFDELAEYPFSSYCNGETVRAGGNEIQPYLADVPVNVAGVTIVPGDIIFADETGVAVVPPDDAVAIFEAAAKIKAMGAEMLAHIADEDPEVIKTQGSKEI